MPFRWRVFVGIGVVVGWLVAPLAAHDVPTDVLVQAFVKPEHQVLRVLLRVPLAAMADVDYPTRGPGGLVDLSRVGPSLRDATTMWIVPGLTLFEDGVRLAPPRLVSARLSLPSDRSFVSYDDALAHVTGPPMNADVQLYWNQASMDVLLEYPIDSDRGAFALRPAFARWAVHVTTVVRFLPPGGAVRAFEWRGDPGLVRLDPTWYQAALGFARLGCLHILSGPDHLLFLLCLVIPLRRFWTLVPVVTAFAAAHSLTLLASALDLAPNALWFPPLVETLIAVSVLYMALENILAGRFTHRWMIALGFGLVHGFGFAFALRESLQFAGGHLLTSLFAFNVGIEAGQLLVLLLLMPPLAWLARRAASERLATIVVSALVAHVAWHWMVDRARALQAFRLSWPDLTAEAGVTVTTWLLIAAGLGGAAWMATMIVARVTRGRVSGSSSDLTPRR
jgi:hypothetical protein